MSTHITLIGIVIALKLVPSYKYYVVFRNFKTLLFTLTIILFAQNILAADDIVIIVNQSNPTTILTHTELKDYFIKKNRTWSSGEAIRFFDFREENKSRKTFLKNYIKKTSREIELYWIGEKIYTGNIAPLQITSDSMMAKMVSRFPGGVGYVSKRFKLPKTVKPLTVKKDL